MERLEKNMKEMEISDKYFLVDWYVSFIWKRIRFYDFFTPFSIYIKLFEGSARHLIAKFNVKTRVYYGNTSMDSEMSLLMANQTLVRFKLDQFHVVKKKKKKLIFRALGFSWKAYLRSFYGNREHGLCQLSSFFYEYLYL